MAEMSILKSLLPFNNGPIPISGFLNLSGMTTWNRKTIWTMICSNLNFWTRSLLRLSLSNCRTILNRMSRMILSRSSNRFLMSWMILSCILIRFWMSWMFSIWKRPLSRHRRPISYYFCRNNLSRRICRCSHMSSWISFHNGRWEIWTIFSILLTCWFRMIWILYFYQMNLYPLPWSCFCFWCRRICFSAWLSFCFWYRRICFSVRSR